MRSRLVDVFVDHIADTWQRQGDGDHHHRQERRQWFAFQILHRAVEGVAHLFVKDIGLTGVRFRCRFGAFWRVTVAVSAALWLAETVESIAELPNLVNCVALIQRGLRANDRRSGSACGTNDGR
ncbi:hypothetical protein D3C76_1100960 [compost metagenome]